MIANLDGWYRNYKIEIVMVYVHGGVVSFTAIDNESRVVIKSPSPGVPQWTP